MLVNIRALKNPIADSKFGISAGGDAKGLFGGPEDQSVEREGSRNVRFFTIGMCFLAATICAVC